MLNGGAQCFLKSLVELSPDTGRAYANVHCKTDLEAIKRILLTLETVPELCMAIGFIVSYHTLF